MQLRSLVFFPEVEKRYTGEGDFSFTEPQFIYFLKMELKQHAIMLLQFIRVVSHVCLSVGDVSFVN